LSNRTAVDTIIGYFYQFDYSIQTLLELEEFEGSITVEGIEDVDVKSLNENTSIQCKYYAKTEYNHSVIAEPIRLMLNHYKELKDRREPSVKYYLYGHYEKGQCKLVLPLTSKFLKEKFLTYTKDKNKRYHHLELGLEDEDLDDFIQRLTINVNATSYENQYEDILKLLETEFQSSRFEAENYYYNNALKVIKELASKNDIQDRKITKRDFLKQINNKQVLFNEWFITLKGKKEFLSNLRKEYFSDFNISPFERFFLIESDQKHYKRFELKELLFLISKNWAKLSQREQRPFCPYVYIHNLPDKELILLKSELYQEGFKIVDGFNFAGASFSPIAICEPANHANGIRLKVINKLEHLDLSLSETKKTKEIYQFYMHDSFYSNEDPGIKHIQFQIEDINDIKEII